MKGFRRLRLFEGALLAALTVSLGASMVPFTQQCEQISTRVIRLHVLANSDSDADQALKLRVRDRVLTETGDCIRQAQSRNDAEVILAELLPTIEQAAQTQVQADGYSYPVHAELTDMYFTTRTYDAGTLPAGTYRALRLTIGEGRGHNWWCVVFPPMCVSAALEPLSSAISAENASGEETTPADASAPNPASSGSADTALDDVLTPEQLDIVENPEHYEVRLKLVEWWEQLTAWLRGE